MRQLDHVVFAARNLHEGRLWLEGQLGVALAAGGEHPTFGTHNALLGLGPLYLEVIAVNPHAPAPKRPRWFGLDTPAMAQRLARGPALIHWVVRGADVSRDPSALRLSRGASHWWLTVLSDGSLPRGGVQPSRIKWLTTPPPMSLPDSGWRLQRLELHTPQPRPVQALAGEWVGGVQVAVERGPQPRLRAKLCGAVGQMVWLE